MKPDNNCYIAIFLPSLLGGGAERAMLNLAHGLADQGCSIDLVLAQAKGPYLQDVQDSIRLVDLQASRVIFSLPALTRYLQKERPQALLSALDYANIVALWASRLAGSPNQIAVNEQNTISRSAHNSSRRRQRIVPQLAKYFYPWADFVIGNSQGVAEDLIAVTGLPPGDIKILYNPVVTPELKEKATQEIDHPWFKKNQPPVVLAVGRLNKQKDFPTLIRAFAKARQDRPARLIILGEGPDRSLLENLVKDLAIEDYVSLPGFVPNPYAYMSHSSLYVLSSLYEGLPTVLIEALYCGLPIVATDCPSGSKEILGDGKFGTLVPVGDVNALADAIQSGLSGKIPKPPEESWKPYALETVVHQYINLFKN